MKITVYNQGGLSHTRLQIRVDRRIDEGVPRRVRYSAADKVKILAAVDRIKDDERVHQSQAASLLQVSPSQITRWRAKSSSLQQVARPDSLQLHKGPAAFLAEEHHFCSHLYLHSTGLVADATSAPVVCAYPDNVNER